MGPVRLPEELKMQLARIAEELSERSGVFVSIESLVNRAVRDLIKRIDGEK